jgi:hypothetical protein
LKEETKMSVTEKTQIAEEMRQEAEPLSPVEKKLIMYSLLIGVVLLFVLVMITGAYRF